MVWHRVMWFVPQSTLFSFPSSQHKHRIIDWEGVNKVARETNRRIRYEKKPSW